MDPLDPFRRQLLAYLHGFIGALALIGGGLLVVWPSGRMLGLSVDLLARTPFDSFLLPGLLLYGAVGLHHAIAAFLTFKREPGAELVSFSSGAALVVYLLVELQMVNGSHWLQYALLTLAAIELVQAVVLRLHAMNGRGLSPATAH